MKVASIQLKKGKEQSISRRHPWIFSGALYRVDRNIKDGELVQLCNAQNEVLATGHYATGSIAVRILSFSQVQINQEFYYQSIQRAYNTRVLSLNLPNKQTNCFRLISGEGDFLPGLIIDIYGNHAVIQCHTTGMLRQVELIADALKQALAEHERSLKIETIYLKAIHIKQQQYDSQFIIGNTSNTIVSENGVQFYVDWTTGQKTGFFLDQRDNRQLIGQLAHGRRVLNTFCYTGGFSAYAMANDAKQVCSVDISAEAMKMTDKNIALNTEQIDKHQSITTNVMQYLNTIEYNAFDLIILDPPAFAKHKNRSHNAIQAYKRLNLAAINKLAPNSLLATFSCSQVITKTLFENTIRSAAIEAGRDIQILKQLNQAPDHTINIYHQEGHYLKGLLLQIL